MTTEAADRVGERLCARMRDAGGGAGTRAGRQRGGSRTRQTSRPAPALVASGVAAADGRRPAAR